MDKKIIPNPGKARKILNEFNLANCATGAEKSKHTLMLGIVDCVRTIIQQQKEYIHIPDLSPDV